MASTPAGPQGTTGRRRWQVVASMVGVAVVLLVGVLAFMSRQGAGAMALGVAAASTTPPPGDGATTAPWGTTTVTATAPPAPTTAASTPSTSRAPAAPAPASTAPATPKPATSPPAPRTPPRHTRTSPAASPPPTPVGRGPDLGGGATSALTTDPALVTAGIGLLAAAGAFATAAVQLRRAGRARAGR